MATLKNIKFQHSASDRAEMNEEAQEFLPGFGVRRPSAALLRPILLAGVYPTFTALPVRADS